MILKSEPEIKNRCTLEGVFRQIPAVIPKSGPEIKNHCTLEVVSEQNPAAIPKSRLEIRNRSSCKPVLQAEPFLFAATKIRIGRGRSLPRRPLQAGHSSLRRRKLESDAEERCLNGRAYGSNFIRHSELCEGARLEFTMSDQANY